MTSKDSTNKKSTHQSTTSISFWKLMKDDLRHRTWMLALSCLAAFLSSPVAYLFYFTNFSERRMLTNSDPELIQKALSASLVSYFGSVHLLLQMIIIYIGAFLVAVFGFRHLFSQKMTDLYHAMPASRNKLFGVQYVNGFITWFMPFLIGHLSVYIMSLFTIKNSEYFGMISVGVFKEILLLAVCFFAVYNACLVPIMLSGNILNSITNILIYGLSLCLGFALCICYMETSFDTYYFNDTFNATLLIMGLSPLVAPVYLCLWFSEFQLSLDVIGRTVAAQSDWIPFLIVAIIIMVSNGILAVCLHQKRPSELAQRGVDNKLFSTAIRVTASLLAGLFLALFFSQITNHMSWMLFSAAFGVIFTFCVINIMHHTQFKAFFTHKLQLIGTLIVTCGIVFLFRFDLLGYDSYLPSPDSIEGISIYSSAYEGPCYDLFQKEDGYYAITAKSTIPEEIIFTDKETIYNFLELMSDIENNESQEYSNNQNTVHLNWNVRVYTKNGSYYRNYNFYETEEMRNAIKPFLEDTAFVEHYNPIGTQTLEAPPKIRAHSLDKTTFEIADADLIQQLYDAYALDFANHPDQNYELANFQLTLLEFMYPYNEYGSYHYGLLHIPAWYTNTIQTLEKLYPNVLWSIEDLNFQSLEVRVNHDPITYHRITETEKLEELRPHLYLSKYNTADRSDYIYVGSIYTSTPDNPNTGSYHCYIKKDAEIPAWLKDLLGM